MKKVLISLLQCLLETRQQYHSSNSFRRRSNDTLDLQGLLMLKKAESSSKQMPLITDQAAFMMGSATKTKQLTYSISSML